MAHGPSSTDETISGINVTPLVDVVLLLLVVLMVTATSIVARSIPLELPKAASGESLAAPLVLDIATDGTMHLDGAPIRAPELRERIRRARAANDDVRAVIAADRGSRHEHVVSAIDLLRSEGVVRFAFHVSPNDVASP